MSVSLSTPFDSIEYQQEGLLLTRCSCAGTSHYYIPRLHVDNIGMGRELWIKMTILGTALTIYGLVTYTDTQGVWDRVALWLGVLILLWCCYKMIPSTLSIVTNNGTFESSKCCNRDSFTMLMSWITGSAGNRVAVSVGGGQAIMMQPMSHGQVVPVALHPSPPLQSQPSSLVQRGWQRPNHGEAYARQSAPYASFQTPYEVAAQPMWQAPSSSSPSAAAQTQSAQAATPRARPVTARNGNGGDEREAAFVYAQAERAHAQQPHGESHPAGEVPQLSGHGAEY